MSSSGQGRPAGAGSLAPGARKVEIRVRGMTCASCAAGVEKKLNAMENVVATVNLATEKATVYAPDGVPVERLVAAIERAGYGAEVAGPVRPGGGAGGRGPAGASAGDAEAAAYLRRRLVVAAVLFVPLTVARRRAGHLHQGLPRA